jgi:hypothetical protein
MTVGKPDFNLNSFGIKYFRKGDDYEDMEGRETVTPKIPTQVKPAWQEGNDNNYTPKGTGSSAKRVNSGYKSRVSASTGDLIDRLDVENRKRLEQPKGKVTEETRSQFLASRDPNTLSHQQRQLLHDSGGDPSKQLHSFGHNKLNPDKREALGGGGVSTNEIKPKGEKVYDSDNKLDSKENVKGQHAKEEKEEGENEVKTRARRRSRASGSRSVGNAPDDVKSEVQNVGGKDVKVGVGIKAHEKFQERDGMGKKFENTAHATEAEVHEERTMLGLHERNNRVGEHKKLERKFRSTATPEQLKEYESIKDHVNDKGEKSPHYDNQRKWLNNNTEHKSVKYSKNQTTRDKESKKETSKKESDDKTREIRIDDMNDRRTLIQSDADVQNMKESKRGSRSRKPLDIKNVMDKPKEDNPNSSTKAPSTKEVPTSITTDNKEDKVGAIASLLAQETDKDKRKKLRDQLTGKKDKDEIIAAKKRIELHQNKEVKIPKEGDLTRKEINAYKKERKLKKNMDELIRDMDILKLDLMKDGIQGGGKNTTEETQDDDGFKSEKQTKEGQAADVRGMNVIERDYNKRLYGGDYHHGRVPREHRDKPHAKPPVTKPYKGKKTDPRILENKLTEKERTKIETTGLRNAGLTDSHLPRGNAWNYKQVPDKELPSSGKGSPADLKEKAAETIFKAISLKLDLMKNTPKWIKENAKMMNDVNELASKTPNTPKPKISKEEDEQADQEHWDGYGDDL